MLRYLREKKDEAVKAQLEAESFLTKNKYTRTSGRTHAVVNKYRNAKIANEIYTDLLRRTRKDDWE